MRSPALLLVLTLPMMFAGPDPSTAQSTGVPSPPDFRAVVFAGLSADLTAGATLGVDAEVTLWRFLAARVEYSYWARNTDLACPDVPTPYSSDCPLAGWAGLAGLVANVPANGPANFYASVAGGRFTREGTFRSPALSLDAGLRLHIFEGLGVRVGGRFLRAFDREYRAPPGQPLRYAMATLGLEYRVTW
ncbi:MAG: hypothetical protein P8174_06020 [Gemmatimonadota bacterium]